MSVHRIRLRGPWEFDWTSTDTNAAGQEAASGQVSMPLAWRDQFGPRPGRVLYRRAFGRPTNLGEEAVAIRLNGIGGSGTVRLNGKLLGELDGTESAARYDVSGQLQERNLLEVELSFDPHGSPDNPGGLWGAVSLEISEQDG